MSDRGRKGLLALGPVAAVLALCCGLPALLAAGGLAALGGVLVACGSWLAAVILLALAGGLGARWWTTRRPGDPSRRGVRRPDVSPEAVLRSANPSPEPGEDDRAAARVEAPHG
jgi:hypothetical protein